MAQAKAKAKGKATNENERTIAANRQASHDYELLDRYEAGLALTGAEIKSIREGKVNLREAYIRIQGGQALLLNCHIAHYQPASYQNQEPTRERTLLLHKQEIRKLAQSTQERGLTIVPTRMYFTRGRAKLEIAVAKGRKSYDKRAAIAERDVKRDIARALRRDA